MLLAELRLILSHDAVVKGGATHWMLDFFYRHNINSDYFDCWREGEWQKSNVMQEVIECCMEDGSATDLRPRYHVIACESYVAVVDTKNEEFFTSKGIHRDMRFVAKLWELEDGVAGSSIGQARSLAAFLNEKGISHINNVVNVNATITPKNKLSCFPENSKDVMVNIGEKSPNQVRREDKWVHGYFIGKTKNGKHAVVEIEEGIHIVGEGQIAPDEMIFTDQRICGVDLASEPDRTVEMTVYKDDLVNGQNYMCKFFHNNNEFTDVLKWIHGGFFFGTEALSQTDADIDVLYPVGKLEPRIYDDGGKYDLPPIDSEVYIMPETEHLKVSNPGRKVRIYSHFTDWRGVQLAAYVSVDYPIVGGVSSNKAFETSEQKKAREDTIKNINNVYETFDLARSCGSFTGTIGQYMYERGFRVPKGGDE